MPARLTYEEVYEYIRSKGCELLSKGYNKSKEKLGYTPYIIKDMGKYNKKFVEQEFEIFMLMRMKC